MAFVLDASVAISWAMRDEENGLTLAVLERARREEALVPALWWLEVGNALLVAERRGRITSSVTSEFLSHLRRLSVVIWDAADPAALLDLARRHRLTVYDATYLELSIRADGPLATLDAALARAARAEGVTVLTASA